MIMKSRRPDRRHFTSPIRDSRRRTREIYYATMSVLVVKIVLFVFLGILFYQSIILFTTRFTGAPAPLRYAVPVLVGAFMVVLVRFIYKNIKDLRYLSRPRDTE